MIGGGWVLDISDVAGSDLRFHCGPRTGPNRPVPTLRVFSREMNLTVDWLPSQRSLEPIKGGRRALLAMV
jgi:hypothetical protein